jgi:hypothetical protein
VDLEAIFRWLVENGLSLNSGKTQAMIMCRDRGRLPALLPAVLVLQWRDQVNYVRSFGSLLM